MIDVICNDCLGILSDKVIIYSSYDMYYDRLLCVKFNFKLQSWFLLLDAECVAERQHNTNGLTRPGLAPMIYYIHSEHYYENYISRITEIVIKN
jgi:hypothetical protein